MSDHEARLVRLEQLLQQILRDLKKIEDTTGQAFQQISNVRNAAGP